MPRRRRALIALALAAFATTFASVAYASFHVPTQQKLLNRGCLTAAARIEKLLNEAATTQTRTIETQVRVLKPGKLAGDIVFNPHGTNISVAGDSSAGIHIDFGCGFGMAGGAGNSGEAGLSEGPGLPTRHLASTVHATFTAPGRYTLTFTLDQRGQKIVAHLGAAERAYRKRHPHGHSPPSITWGVGLHFRPNGARPKGATRG